MIVNMVEIVIEIKDTNVPRLPIYPADFTAGPFGVT